MRLLAAAGVALLVVSAAAAGRFAGALTISPDKLPDGVVGKPYSVSIKPSGGTNPRLITCGEFGFDRLPKGLEQKASNPGEATSTELRVVGTPQQAGEFIMDVCATNDEAQSFRRVYEFKVTGAAADTADVTIKTGEPEKLEGGFIRIAVTVRNAGPGEAKSVVLSGSLLSKRIDAVSPASKCDDSPATFRCSLGDLARGAAVTILVSLRKADKDSRVYDVLSVNAKSPTKDDNMRNNGDRVELSEELTADLSVSMSGPATSRGDVVEWVIRIKNLGPDPAAAELVDEAPFEVTFEKVFYDRRTTGCTLRPKLVECSTGLIEPTDRKGRVVTIRGRIVRGDETVNRVRVSIVPGSGRAAKPRDPDLGNNTARLTTER